MRFWALFLASILLAESLQAATYYVAKTGRDSNAGTVASPFLTLSKGLAALRSGDTLYIRAGTYAEGIRNNVASGSSWGSPTTVAAYAGERVVLAPTSGSRVVEFSDRHHIVIDGLILDGKGVGYNVVKIVPTAHHIKIRNSELMNSKSQGILVTSLADSNEFINLKVHDNGSDDLDHGFYINSSNNLVERCEVYRNAGAGVQIYTGYAGRSANNNIIRYNRIHDNARVGERGAGVNMTAGTGNIAHHNLIWNNGSGIQANWGAINVKIYSNTVYKNLRYAIYLGKGAGDNQGGPAYGATVRNNILFQNGSGLTSDMSGTVISNNLTADPLFVGASAADFKLRAGSPAIDKGYNLAGEGLTADFAGSPRPQGAAYDIGAFEYAGASPAPAPTTPTSPTPAPPGCQTVSSAWKNVSVPSQTGAFTAIITATPLAAKMDGLIGLSNGAASSYASLAAVVRFNTSGGIDARSGSAYTAAASIPYSPNLPYTFRLVVDIAAHRYSAYVKQGANAERLIGANLAFRTEQAAVKTLNNSGLFSSVGSQIVCAPTVSAAAPTGDTAAPVISAVTATGLTSTGASIQWTTNEPSDTQVEYGLTTAYGASTVLNPTLSTSHSAALSGLKGGSPYHYRVKSKDAAGNLATSSDLIFTTPPTTGGTSCLTSASTWRNAALPARTGTFTVEFDATPSAGAIDGVAGLSNGAASAYAALAAAVRFNNAGRIDARRGGAYAASASIPYAAGAVHHFRLVVNMATRTYSAYVRRGAGTEQLIGANYAFRTEQNTVTSLSNLAVYATGGNEIVCNALVK